jgi:hypothetical protein
MIDLKADPVMMKDTELEALVRVSVQRMRKTGGAVQ